MSDRMPDIPRTLVQRARGGDDEALEALVEAAYPRVRRWAAVQSDDASDADDLTQDVMILMIRRLETFRGDAAFSTWLYAITHHAALDRRRRGLRRKRAVEDPRAHASGVGDGTEAIAVLERAEVDGVVRALFEELPGRQREVFDLVELQGLSPVEVGALLGIAPVSVRASLFKARRTLRARILATRPEVAEDVR